MGWRVGKGKEIIAAATCGWVGAIVPYDLVVHRFNPRPATAQGIGTGSREVDMRQPIVYTISRAIIACGTADRDSQRSGCLESLVHRLHCLGCPVDFSGAPTNRDD